MNVLILLLLGSVVRAAVLRTIYIDPNGRDVRFEVFIDRWWAGNISETVTIPAGTVIKRRNGTTLLETNNTLPLDLQLQFRNPVVSSRARLAFNVQRDGEVNLQLSQYVPVNSCPNNILDCFKCGSSNFRTQTVTTTFSHGRFLDPFLSAKVAYEAELSAQKKFIANVTWDTTFPRNQIGNSTNGNVTGWIVYLSGAQGDTGRVVVDQLVQFKAFSADTVPEGFLVPADVVDTQSFLNLADARWKQQGCPVEPGAGVPLLPYPTLAQSVTNSTNAFYGGRKLRSCAFHNRQPINTTIINELTCSYDDLDLAIVIRLTDGLQLLDVLRYAAPPPPSLPSTQAPRAPQDGSPSAPLPATTVPGSPAVSQGLSGCFITNSDCGDHGSLKALSPSGCTCLCEPGWRHSGQPSSSRFYCSEFTGLPAPSPPPPLSPAELWRNITTTPPPPPKIYVSKAWWERMGPAGWLSITCGLFVLGVLGVLCTCYGGQLWARCCLRSWQRPARDQQQAYEQIQALRQQLQDLQRKMAAD